MENVFLEKLGYVQDRAVLSLYVSATSSRNWPRVDCTGSSHNCQWNYVIVTFCIGILDKVCVFPVHGDFGTHCLWPILVVQ